MTGQPIKKARSSSLLYAPSVINLRDLATADAVEFAPSVRGGNDANSLFREVLSARSFCLRVSPAWACPFGDLMEIGDWLIGDWYT